MHPHFARGESDVENTLWKDLFFFFFSEETSPFPQQTKMFIFFFFLLSKLCCHWKKTKPKSKCCLLLALPSTSCTRGAISKELFESLGAKPEGIPHALQTAGLKLFSGLSLYD